MLWKADFDTRADFDAAESRLRCGRRPTLMLQKADFICGHICGRLLRSQIDFLRTQADFYLQAQADYLLVWTQALSVAKIDFDAETGQLFR